MKEFITTIANQRRLRQLCLGFANVIILALVVLMGGMTAAAAGRGTATAAGHKTAPDFDIFQRNSDGTVDVIIQFKHALDPHHATGVAGRGGKTKRLFRYLKGGAFRVPAAMLPELEKNPEVLYVTPDRYSKPKSDQFDITATMADLARQQYGLDGTGIGVAVIDSGVYNHDDLQTADRSASRIVYSESFVDGDASTNDAYGHGTHVAGIVGGNGFDSQNGYAYQYVGLAPNANIINLRVLDANGGGTDSQVIAAIERAIQLQSTYNIRVINLSAGRPVFESYTMDPLCQAVEAAWNAGIVVVVAAGNEGRDNSLGTHGYASIGSPANDPLVITVGATKTMDTPDRTDDEVASYSSKGPTLVDHIVKPDLVAPGNQVVSLLSPGSTLAVTYPALDVSPAPTCDPTTGSCVNGNAQYLQLSGTSMATPVVAGAAALMIQQDPTLTPDTVKARMMKTAWKGYPATSTSYDNLGNVYFSQYDIFTVGSGYLDVDAVLGNSDVATASAASQTATYDPTSGQAALANSVAGTSIIWGSSSIWPNSIIWGNLVDANSIIWGASYWGDNTVTSTTIVWGDSIVWGNSIVWGESIIWGDSIDASSSLVTDPSAGGTL